MYLNHLYLSRFISISFFFFWIICFAIDFQFLFENSSPRLVTLIEMPNFFGLSYLLCTTTTTSSERRNAFSFCTPNPVSHHPPRAICCKAQNRMHVGKSNNKSSLSHTDPPNRLGGSPTQLERPEQPRASCPFGHRSLASCSLLRNRSFLRYAEVKHTLRRTSTPKPNPKLG